MQIKTFVCSLVSSDLSAQQTISFRIELGFLCLIYAGEIKIIIYKTFINRFKSCICQSNVIFSGHLCFDIHKVPELTNNNIPEFCSIDKNAQEHFFKHICETQLQSKAD